MLQRCSIIIFVSFVFLRSDKQMYSGLFNIVQWGSSPQDVLCVYGKADAPIGFCSLF